MKKKYVFISVMIVIITFSLIAFLTNLFNSEGEKKVNVAHNNLKKNVESIEYYLYEKCDEQKEKKYIKIDYFMINDYFLLDDEFINIVDYINDNKYLLKSNQCNIKDNCQNNDVKKIIIKMEDDSLIVLNNLCHDNKVNEFLNNLEKKLNDILTIKEKELKELSKPVAFNLFLADNIVNVEYNNMFPWIFDDGIEGYSLKIQNGTANFSNDSKYYSLYKESYEVDNNNWNNLLNYIEKNIRNISNPKFASCLDGGESSVVITLNNKEKYKINAYCGGDETFKNLYNEIDKAIGVGIIKKYEENVQKYDMAKDAINSPIDNITIVEEPGINELGFIINNLSITFYQKKNDEKNNVKSNVTKSFDISLEQWNNICKYLNDSFVKNNKELLDKTIIVKRENGVAYSSDIYNKFYSLNTYNEIIKIIGEKKFDNYKKMFYDEINK